MVQTKFQQDTCSEVIAEGLVLLFTASLDQGQIPDDWKHANVTPLFKGGNKNRSIAENYRPVSLTSITCKLMEHIVHSHIMYHFDENQTLTEVQHGFRKNRSCETQLLETIDNLAKALNNREQIDSILLDFSKAFDKVYHRKLLIKLYGITGNIHNWITDFLHNRTQRVLVRGTFSEPKAVKSGVPQGTVLGPLLFLAYINDMPENIKSKIALFADDAYVYKSIKSEEDVSDLQNDIDQLVKWEKLWSMEFHPSKCFLLRITNKRKILQGEYNIHNHTLKLVDSAKYLGVTISKDLSWKKHIAIITSKATNTRLFLQRNLTFTDSETRLLCYKTYIRPIVEYASAVWNPVGNSTLTSKLESVQRKSLRWIHSKWTYGTSPTAQMKSSKLTTLDSRKMLITSENAF